ncbi:beta/gamma crystallin-related protein [Burkholderiaceae bacterium UC74_6]
MKTKNVLGIALCAAGLMAATQAMADVTFFENDNFTGRSVVAGDDVRNLSRYGFNDRASSLTVDRGRWEVCEDVNFGGHCAIVRPGSYNSLRSMGLNDRISSVRRVNWDESVSRYDARPRRGERLYEANVISVHAVVGPPEQRCWVERQSVVEEGGNRTGGAIAGALIGGILGHQIGGGSGRDLATVGGVVAGAAVGSNIAGNQGDRVVQQDVQRCRTVPSQARPDFWDVSYTFRGMEHHVQTTEPPGPTITVNRDGEPRLRD